MENTFTPERRLEIYKEAQLLCVKHNYEEGLCFMIGIVAFGSYWNSPWDYWHEMQPYFQELRHWELEERCYFTPYDRREILESAIAEVTELINSKP
jgi:hypothetical protein